MNQPPFFGFQIQVSPPPFSEAGELTLTNVEGLSKVDFLFQLCRITVSKPIRDIRRDTHYQEALEQLVDERQINGQGTSLVS